MRRFTRQILAATVLATLLLTGCSGMPENTPDPDTVTALGSCPSSPNCVSTAAEAGDSHFIAPIQIQGEADAAWDALVQILEADKSYQIAASNDRYLRAVATTLIMRFKDDVEFLLNRETGQIEMRSASRVGYSDMGKNRKRLEAIRSTMIEAGVASANE